MARQTTITIETDSLLLLRGRTSIRAWCSRCAAEVDVVAMKDAPLSNLDQPALEEWLNPEERHRPQATDGSAPTCLNSLLTRMQKTKTS